MMHGIFLYILKVDFFHLEHFMTLNVSDLGLGIVKNLRRGYTLEFGLNW